MKSFDASSIINAAPDRIWAILTDGPHYPDWDSGVLSVDGTIALGGRSRSSPAPIRVGPFRSRSASSTRTGR